MSAPLRVGLVGCGRLAAHGYAPAAARCAELELAALADSVPERARGLATRLGLDPHGGAHASAEELIAAGGVDAIVVATPAPEHLAAARAAALAGLPCLVEKPPAPDAAGARELVALAPAPWIGFNRRFAQGAELVGEIPPGPLELDAELRYRRASWGAHSVADDALLDLGPHLVDLSLLLSGAEDARVVSARSDPRRAELVLETARGPATLRCATDRPHLERVVVRGAGATVTSVSGGPAGAVLGRLRRRPHPLVASLTAQLRAFAAAVRGRPSAPLATAADGVRTMELIDAARRLAA